MVLTPSPLLDVSEVAAKLHLTEEHTRRLLRAGELPGLKIGKAWRVDAESEANDALSGELFDRPGLV